jgi:hypothetical protein
MYIWGCGVLVSARDTKKSEDCAEQGFFNGYAKSLSLLRWFDDTTNNVKHAHGARLLELDPIGAIPTMGQCLLQLESAYKEGDLDLPLVTIDVGNCAHFETNPFTIQLPLPNTDVTLNFHLAFDETYHLPYIVNTDQDTAFGRVFPPKFCHHVYLLAIAEHDPVTVKDALAEFSSKQRINDGVTIEVWIIKRNNNH